MEYIATLVGIFKRNEISEELLPFVEFKAKLEGREVLADDRVAIFNILTTRSYLVVFLDKEKRLEDIEKEIEEQGYARLNQESRTLLEKALAV